MWFWYGLLAAVISAVSVVYNKHALKSISPKLLTWAMFAVPTIPLIIITLISPKSSINNWFFVGVIGSASIFMMAKLWQMEAIQQGVLSKLVPLASLSTVFTYLFSVIFLSEQINFVSFLGLLIIIIGTYLLNVETAKEHIFMPFTMLFKRKDSLLIMLAIILGSITAIFDKTGLNNTYPTNPTLTYLSENLLMIIPFTIYLLLKEKNAIADIKNNYLSLSIAGLIYAASTFVLLYSFASGPVVLSTALKQTQIIFIMLLSYLLYNDKPLKHVWLATFIMLAGVVLIKIS